MLAWALHALCNGAVCFALAECTLKTARQSTSKIICLPPLMHFRQLLADKPHMDALRTVAASVRAVMGVTQAGAPDSARLIVANFNAAAEKLGWPAYTAAAPAEAAGGKAKGSKRGKKAPALAGVSNIIEGITTKVPVQAPEESAVQWLRPDPVAEYEAAQQESLYAVMAELMEMEGSQGSVAMGEVGSAGSFAGDVGVAAVHPSTSAVAPSKPVTSSSGATPTTSTPTPTSTPATKKRGSPGSSAAAGAGAGMPVPPTPTQKSAPAMAQPLISANPVGAGQDMSPLAISIAAKPAGPSMTSVLGAGGGAVAKRLTSKNLVDLAMGKQAGKRAKGEPLSEEQVSCQGIGADMYWVLDRRPQGHWVEKLWGHDRLLQLLATSPFCRVVNCLSFSLTMQHQRPHQHHVLAPQLARLPITWTALGEGLGSFGAVAKNWFSSAQVRVWRIAMHVTAACHTSLPSLCCCKALAHCLASCTCTNLR